MSGGSRHLGIRIQHARKQAELTRRRLAEATDIPVFALYQIETGYADVSVGRLRKLAHALGLRLDVRLQAIDAPPSDVTCNACFHSPTPPPV